MIGECGVKPSDYWRLTEAETSAIIVGHQNTLVEEAANFRNLYHLIYSVNSKKKKTPQSLWPLPIDKKESTIDIEDRLKLYEKIKMN